ncbi:similar to Saccharomyces cerevisiae YBL095W Putative protein of unknown function [Maudiozyma barnettii]|uniref:Thioesterase domain-containing protein n=1 Tax=Maudiozyma barnettii TaxID=61262 RepID=A0A8H2VHZ8_9SACH|nr:Mrx3p [Kazachstania barnettii]CAB4255905.1 similar to Saccharomyces cerevisiae YBL095W Putative protein of unknown function [Kazachstania barnettii]CAD1784465.1 similar to Saccharomyces cerevisiae YBL095W Putative protein of unknown function [Kazachstania barnettii]
MSRFSVLKGINRVIILPTAGFTLGVATFIKGWPDESEALTLEDQVQESSKVYSKSKQPLYLQRLDILHKISNQPLYKELMMDPDVKHTFQSEGIPQGHRFYHVGQGQLFGPGKLEIDPLVFMNEKKGEIVVFYHLGKDLGNERGQIHKGVLSLLLDEGLCFCGFPRLPNKRGVTAKLSIEFAKEIPQDSTIVLRAHVSESKGRKCIIDGSLESLPQRNIINKILRQGGSSDGTIYVKSKCILVEPKWFKYFSWVNLFDA